MDAIITKNVQIANNVWVMTVSGLERGDPGQFFMLRTIPMDCDPLLSRPMSIMDADDNETSFCYRVSGRGTVILSKLRSGDKIYALGPLGKGFPYLDAKAVLVGGGIGIAPLYYLAKVLKSCGADVTAFLGYNGEEKPLLDEMKAVCDVVFVSRTGNATDIVFCDKESIFYACGPSVMLEALSEKTRVAGAKCYVSLERHLACGVGACRGCTIPTRSGNRRICKDGPVFDSREIYFYD